MHSQEFSRYPYDCDALRDLPLGDVLTAFGGKRMASDVGKYQMSDASVYVVREGGLFIESNSQKFGRGAIDLVTRVADCGFFDALRMLTDIKAGRAITHTSSTSNIPNDVRPKGLKLPMRSDANLGLVLHYLIKIRGISEPLVRQLLESNRVYADSRQSVVMVMRDGAGEAIGAEIRSRHEQPRGVDGHHIPKFRFCPGTKRHAGAFFVNGSDPKGRVALVPNGIEAMSYVSLRPTETAISLGDFINHNLIDWLGRSLKNTGLEVVSAMPVSPAGLEGAEILRARFAFPHLRPDNFHPDAQDWNHLLSINFQLSLHRAQASDDLAGTSPRPKPALEAQSDVLDCQPI